MESKTKATITTIIISIISVITTSVLNLVYNIYFIKIYGAAVNGLISTLVQFTTLFSVLEGGFTMSAVVAIYSPIIEKKYDILNNVLFTAKKYFLKIGITIGGLILLFGSIYIKFINSPFKYKETFILLFICTLCTVFSLTLLASYNVFLQGMNKEYVLVRINLLSNIVSWIISMILILNNISVIYVYAINIFKILINSIIIYYYEKKKYPFLTYKGTYNAGLIPGTRDLFIQKVANAVFTSTDLIVISTFLNLKMASVYNIYFTIYRSAYSFLESIAQAPFNSFGLLLRENRDRERTEKLFLLYSEVIILVSNIIFTTVGTLIIPFLQIYTKDIKEINYVYSSLAFLLYTQFFLQSTNKPFGTILSAAGEFKVQNFQCVLGTICNIFISIALIPWIGFNSIVVGSCIGTFIILVFNIFALKDKLFNKVINIATKSIMINYLSGIVLIWTGIKYDFKLYNYIEWILLAIVFFTVNSVLLFVINYICFPQLTKEVYIYFKNILLKFPTLKK